MNNNNYVKHVVTGIIEIFVSVIMFISASSKRDDWRFHFDEEVQNTVYILYVIGVLFLVFSLVSFVSAIVNYKKGYNHILCPHCSKPIPDYYTVCNHCGKNVKMPGTQGHSAVNNFINSTSESEPNSGNSQKTSSDPKKQTVECIFCGKQIDYDKNHCDHCGRRQD